MWSPILDTELIDTQEKTSKKILLEKRPAAGWVSRQYPRLIRAWTASPRGCWSVAQILLGGKYPAVYPRGQCCIQSCSTSSLMISMMGQTAPSATLLRTPNWEVWLIHHGHRTSCCYPEGPQQAGKMAWQEPLEVQQGVVQKRCPEEEQPQASTHTGCHPAAKQLSRRRPWGPGGHQVKQEPPIHLRDKEG